MKRRGVLSLLLLATSVALGAVREFLFVNLNYQLDYLNHERDQSYAHSSFQRLVHGLDAGQLATTKWLLAFAFIGATLALTLVLARVRLGDARLDRAAVVTFLSIGGLALALHLASGAVAFLYPISVQLLHALQYPVPLLVVWAITWNKGS